MKRRAIISRAAAAGWLACQLTVGSAWAANGPGAPNVTPPVAPNVAPGLAAGPTAPAAATDANTRIPPPAPIRSPLDSEPIRRGGGGSGGPSGVDNGAGSNLSPGLELSRVGMALAIVLSLIFVGRWVMRRLFHQGTGGRSTRAVQVLARAPLAPRQHVVLLLVGRRLIVVGDSGAQMTPLCEITDGDEIAALLGQLQDEKSKLPAKAFSALFQRAKHDMGGEEEESDAAAEAEETDSVDLTESQTPASAPEPATADSVSVSDTRVSDTHNEITGLMAKIRVLSSHFRNPSA